MKELLLELTDFIIVASKRHNLEVKILEAIKVYDYESAVKLRNKMRKLKRTIGTIKKLEKLRNKLTTKDK